MAKLHQHWTLKEWLTDLEARHTQEIQLGLDRIKRVAEIMRLLTPVCPVITVAGTNGKGSTVAALEQIYCSAGYTTGAYTSPHLLEFNERIRINKQMIADTDLCHAFSLIEAARGDIALTYFEMTTLAALYYFQQQAVEVMILEVGLGGRLDATNILDADLAIITTIDFDHQDFLGNTLEAIGYEKAGILRQGTPFIYADINPPSSVIEAASGLAAPTYLLDRDYCFYDEGAVWVLGYEKEQINNLPKPHIQLKSAAAAIFASVLLAKRLPVAPDQLRCAMQQVFISGRLQLEKAGEISILYDVSHNPQSARLLAKTLSSLAHGGGAIHAVFSALQDKDISGLIEPLKDCIDYWYPAQLDIKRAAPANLLLERLAEAEIFVKICYNSPLIALEAALSHAKSGDLIVVYGSFFTVGYVLAARPK